jgi:hypothetical protein
MNHQFLRKLHVPAMIAIIVMIMFIPSGCDHAIHARATQQFIDSSIAYADKADSAKSIDSTNYYKGKSDAYNDMGRLYFQITLEEQH